MASAKMTITLALKDLASVKLLVVRLRLLHDEMRVMASPHAAELGQILESFESRMSDGGPDDGAEPV